jgi:poly(A)-specific ribonuclease
VWLQVRQSAEGFVINQIGFAAFRLVEEKWEAKTYNFTIFPREFEDVSKIFSCDSGSLGFLATHKFDFNKMIYKGIPFMSLQQQERLLQVGCRCL